MPNGGTWLTCKSELASAGINGGPLWICEPSLRTIRAEVASSHLAGLRFLGYSEEVTATRVDVKVAVVVLHGDWYVIGM